MSFARVRAYVVVGVLVVLALGGVVLAIVRDTQGDPVADACKGAVLVNVSIPDGPQEVSVRVLNGTGRAGLANALTTDLSNRGFHAEKPGPATKKIDEVAVLRYGPEAVSGAWLVRAYFLNQAERQYDPKRKGAVVDVVVGTGYLSLATPTEVALSIKEVGEPQLPAGTCAAPRTEVKAGP